MLLTPERTLDERYPAEPRSIRLVRSEIAAFAARRGATDDQLERIRLAASEAATNVVRHAYRSTPGDLYVIAAALDHEFWLLIADDGCGHQSPPTDPGLGWGLALIAHVSDDFVLTERSGGGTEARMRFSLGS
jgi:anti-sigma regulatory factor (Ser/Thr protein kinase)